MNVLLQESMLDKLSDTWQQTLNSKELEISKLQSQLQNNSSCSSITTPHSHPNPQVSNTVFSLCLYN